MQWVENAAQLQAMIGKILAGTVVLLVIGAILLLAARSVWVKTMPHPPLAIDTLLLVLWVNILVLQVVSVPFNWSMFSVPLLVMGTIGMLSFAMVVYNDTNAIYEWIGELRDRQAEAHVEPGPPPAAEPSNPAG